ncbi:MAG TPA: CrcB family protein [Flavobacteriales bacterium]|nr:CrcB family protein [Flavobacteriales bacterium]HRO38808.1 CrcB family protein [Flavobacteriales bacterium]HRP81628.1 CrcB family protein [Flavobacteriales bacterium]HRQ84739.1 CrcB family protein [Flavobacteriales bacterium]
MNIWAAIFIGGGIGSLMRYGITRLLLAMDLRGAFPWATLLSNLLSTAILAWMLLRMQAHFQHRPALSAFVAVGICGGFSTFSTFSYENFLLFREGSPGMAMANIAVNVLACFSIFWFVARSA